MASLIAAYGIVWIGVVAYVTRLGIQQRRLAERAAKLEQQLQNPRSNSAATSRAA